MNRKRTFGAIMILLGVIGLVYTGAGIVNHSELVNTMWVVGIVALLFFFEGISLMRETPDIAE